MDQKDELSMDELISSIDEPVKAYHPAPPDEAETVSGDTIRLDKICKAVAETEDNSLENTAVFAAVEEEDLGVEEEPVGLTEEDPVEPFSEEWEPEYDEPMGD